MPLQRWCQERKANGEPCGATPLRDAPYCFWHSPEHQDAVQEAQRLGGLRRRREATLAGAYDVQGLGSVEEVRRLVEIAVLDLLGLENSIARARALLAAAQVAARLLETGELEERIAALEAFVGPQGTRGRRTA